MKFLIALSLAIVLSNISKAQEKPDSLLLVLKAEIKNKSVYDQEKESQLKKLKKELAFVPKNDVLKQYALYDEIVEAYKSYKFDSAHVYAYQLMQVGNLLKNRQKQFESKVKFGALQLSWGMYKEAFECIAQLDSRLLPDSTKLQYYALKARALNELAAYNTNRFYSPANRIESIKMLDSAVRLSKPGTYDEYKFTGQYLIITKQKAKAITLLTQLLNNSRLNIHQRAMVANDLSYLVNSEQKEKLLITAAIYDIRSSTKQTQAIFRLGTRFFRRGDLENAEWLLKEALLEAQFYGNDLQEKSIKTILTQLATQKLIKSENQKNNVLIVLITIVSIALLGIAFVSYIVYKSLIKVRVREAVVREKYQYLDSINKRLVEDGHIKEEYIGHFFHLISGYISRLEKIKRNTEQKLKIKNYEGLLKLAKEIDIKQERENLFYTFDTVFLKLFPNFINAFNALLKPEDQIWPKGDEVLNINLRIFALMRLGIKDAQTIANILESTLSTIYTYRNRIKAKAFFHGDEFDNKIMEIKFVEIEKNSSENLSADLLV